MKKKNILDILWNFGASVHVVDSYGRTPLHAASSVDNKATMRWLVGHGAPRRVVDRDHRRPGEVLVGFIGTDLLKVYHGHANLRAEAAHSCTGSDSTGDATKTDEIETVDTNRYLSFGREQHVLLRTSRVCALGAGDKAGDSAETGSATNAAATDDNTTELSQAALAPAAPTVNLCHSGSERKHGSCGCVDDLYERWFIDRVSAQWLPQELIQGMSAAQSQLVEYRRLTEELANNTIEQTKSSSSSENDGASANPEEGGE